MRKKTRHLCLLALLALVTLCAVELWRASVRRSDLGLGTDAARTVVLRSVQDTAEHLRAALSGEEVQVVSSTGIVSDHDLYMLVAGAQFWIGHDEALTDALADGRLPLSFSLLDGYDVGRVALRRAIAEDLAVMEPGERHVSPTLLGLPASPNVHEVAAGVVDDEPLLAVHTQGQVLTSDVHAVGVRYRLSCVTSPTSVRAAEIRELERRAAEVAAQVEALAGADADDYAYVRAAFDLLSRTVSYAQKGSSVHDNDAYGALVEGSARCYGLSGALKLVLDARGIPNYIADGTKASGRHSWNVLYLDGGWRVCDLTLMVDAREGNAGLSADPEHKGIYACLALERTFYDEHGYQLDNECRLLELVYSRVVTGT